MPGKGDPDPSTGPRKHQESQTQAGPRGSVLLLTVPELLTRDPRHALLPGQRHSHGAKAAKSPPQSQLHCFPEKENQAQGAE